MARQINRLVARSLEKLPPGKHADGNGLYLFVTKNGTRSWVYKYSLNGQRKEAGLGSLSDVPLSVAREKARDFTKKDSPDTKLFSEVATDLIESMKSGWKNVKHGKQWTATLTTHAKSIWKMPVSDVETQHITEALMPIWSTIPETASRVRSRIEHVLNAATVKGFREGANPARWKGHLEFLLPKRNIKRTRVHHPAMPYGDIAGFIRLLRGRDSTAARALEFLILTAARTNEVTKMRWSEIDMEKKVWTVPKERMKTDTVHRVPLTDAALFVLNHMVLRKDGEDSFVFPGGKAGQGLSNAAMEMLLRRMKLDDYTVHGFRSSFRDWVGEETDHPREVGEAALAHAVGNEVERAYRRGDALEKRRRLMEDWAAYVTGSQS